MTLYNQRLDKLERNERVWVEVVINGKTQREVAREEGISEQRVSVIMRQVEATIPIEEKDFTRKYRREFLAHLQKLTMEIAHQGGQPKVAPNGKIVEGVYDYSEVIAAINTAIKLDERLAKLSGTDNAVDHTVRVSVEAQTAVQEQADKVSAQFAGLIPMSPEVASYAAKGG